MSGLNPRQRDRALGAVLGAALADAAGAPYEFSTSCPGIFLTGGGADMVGGGALCWEVGEWTDDTAMTVPLLRALSTEGGLTDDAALDAVAAEWVAWSRMSPDVGIQTRKVLDAAADAAAMAGEAVTAARLRFAAAALHEQTGRTAGNGSLMRTAPASLVGLLEKGGDARAVHAARLVSELTHFDPEAAEACAIWTLALRSAILRGSADVLAAAARAAELGAIAPERAETWLERIREAMDARPGDFPNNGWVVHAFQAAVAAATQGAILGREESGGVGARYLHTVEAAINAAGDTDTVACIAGALAGAELGASALPFPWVRAAHGWPDMTAQDLAGLVAKAVAGATRV